MKKKTIPEAPKYIVGDQVVLVEGGPHPTQIMLQKGARGTLKELISGSLVGPTWWWSIEFPLAKGISLHHTYPESMFKKA
jgi:hypothetical protein